MKRFLVLACMCALMLGLAVPARAGLPAITYCRGVVGGVCYSNRGVAANMDVFNPTLQTGGTHVSSIYIYSTEGSDAYVEFGWTQDKPLGYGDRVVFIRVWDGNNPDPNQRLRPCDGGGTSGYNTYEETYTLADNLWRFQIYQESSAPGKFKFVYYSPGGGNYHYMPCTVTMTGSVTQAYAITSTEILKQGNPSDQASWWHKDIWMLNGSYVWKAVNSTNSMNMQPFGAGDQIQWYYSRQVAGSGGTGDQINYWLCGVINCT